MLRARALSRDHSVARAREVRNREWTDKVEAHMVEIRCWVAVLS